MRGPSRTDTRVVRDQRLLRNADAFVPSDVSLGLSNIGCPATRRSNTISELKTIQDKLKIDLRGTHTSFDTLIDLSTTSVDHDTTEPSRIEQPTHAQLTCFSAFEIPGTGAKHSHGQSMFRPTVTMKRKTIDNWGVIAHNIPTCEHVHASVCSTRHSSQHRARRCDGRQRAHKKTDLAHRIIFSSERKHSPSIPNLAASALTVTGPQSIPLQLSGTPTLFFLHLYTTSFLQHTVCSSALPTPSSGNQQ